MARLSSQEIMNVLLSHLEIILRKKGKVTALAITPNLPVVIYQRNVTREIVPQEPSILGPSRTISFHAIFKSLTWSNDEVFR